MTGTKRLEIVQVVCSDGFAGVERHVAGLARGLSLAGHDVTVFGGDGARMSEEFASTSVDWAPADSIGSAVARMTKRRRADVVHAHMTAAEAAAVLARPVHRARIVSTRHFARPRGSSAAVRLAARLLQREIAAEIAVSRYVAHAVGHDPRVILSGVRAPADVAAPESRAPTVLVVSRLESEKRVDVALRVWARSRLARRGWELVIAGDGAERGRLEHLAADLGVGDSCRFLGSRNDVPELLECASILLATCPVEAFGLSVVEAMAHGVPVVAVAQGAHQEILGLSRGATLFDVDDPSAGAHLLRALAEDECRRVDYGRSLRGVQQANFTTERQVREVEDVYRSLLP